MKAKELAEIIGAAEGHEARMELEDVMATIFLRSYRDVPLSSAAADELVGAFLARVGVQTQEDVDALPERIAAYFERRPLRTDLLEQVTDALVTPGERLGRLPAALAMSSAFTKGVGV